MVLGSSPESWTVYDAGFGEGDKIVLPHSDLKAILEDRVRWRAYGHAWEVQRMGRVLDGIAEVTSG